MVPANELRSFIHMAPNMPTLPWYNRSLGMLIEHVYCRYLWDPPDLM